jgi:hypothetical protein
VLYHEDRVLRAAHSHRGIVPIERWAGVDGLGALAQREGARFAVAAEAFALEELHERLGGRLRPDDDAFTTALVALGALRELHEEGAIHVWPKLLPERVPLPAPAVLQRTLDFVLPRGRAACVVLFDRDAVDTALLVRRTGATIDRVLGPEALAEMCGPLGGDFRRDYRRVRDSVERALAPLAFGLYSETATLHSLLRETEAGAWARALASRDVVLDPMPSWALVAAGAGVVRAAATRSRGVFGGLGPWRTLLPGLARLREVSAALSSLNIPSVLGFNPLRVLALVLGRSSPTGSRPRDEQLP